MTNACKFDVIKDIDTISQQVLAKDLNARDALLFAEKYAAENKKQFQSLSVCFETLGKWTRVCVY